MEETMRFLGKPAEELRAIRGRDLYEALAEHGLTHGQYFRALDTNIEAYCAEEFGIDLNRITVDRFFQSDPNAKWLFPDVVRQAVLDGLRGQPAYPRLIAGDERVSGAAYSMPYVVETAAEEELRGVAEGAAIPESEITYGDRVVRLDKKGRGVVASYEAVRRMSVDLLRVHLRRIGARLGRSLDARLASVLVNGDSSGAGTAPVVLNTAVSGAWAYDDLLNGYLTLSQDHYFTPTHLVGDKETVRAILNLDEMKDSRLFDFNKTGSMPTPLGAALTPMADHPADRLTVLDAGFAVQKLTEQDLHVESDKLINQQWERTYLTVVTDFAVLYEKARVVLRSDWT